MSGPEGNSEFCFPETLIVPRGEVKWSVEVEGKQNLLFPQGQSVSVLLYLPTQIILSAYFLKQPSKITSPEQVFKNENVREQSSISGEQETFSFPDNNLVPVSASLFQGQPLIENNFPPSQSTGNVSSDEYVLTELQPRNFQPPTCVPSSSQGEYPQNESWFVELNEWNGQNDIDQEEGEDSIFHDGEEEIDSVSEMHSEIQQCLSLNRDYQVITFFNLHVFNRYLCPIFAEIVFFDHRNNDVFAWNKTKWQSLGVIN